MLQRFAMALSAVGLAMTVACSQSDTGITTAVKTKMATDDTVKASEINVDTNHRVVTLTGTVDSEAAKNQAVLIARGTKGVTDVVDRIEVNRAEAPTTGAVEQKSESAGQYITDAAITSDVKTKFLAEPGVSGLKIDVDTTDGVVTLSGNVKNRAMAEKAMSIARGSAGVKQVVDKMHVE
jgi:hyperosmotically inducible protein